MIFKQQQETEKKYLDQTRKCTLPPKKNGLFETIARKNNPNNGVWVELLLYLLDHSLIGRLLIWCVTAVANSINSVVNSKNK